VDSLEGNFSILHRLMSECAAESSYHAAPAVLKFEAVSGDIRVEMLIDNDPSHGSRSRLAQVTRTGVFASGSKKYLDLAVSAPERYVSGSVSAAPPGGEVAERRDTNCWGVMPHLERMIGAW
jgi:hypothetical protein